MKPILDPRQRYWDGYQPVEAPDDDHGHGQDDERIEVTQTIPPVGEPAVESGEDDPAADRSGRTDADEWDRSKPTYADPHLLDAFREDGQDASALDMAEDPEPVDDVMQEPVGSARSTHAFRRKPIFMATIVLAAALCVPSGMHAYRAHGHSQALTACLDAVETERTAYEKTSGLPKRHARESGYTADDVADPDLVRRLADLMDVVGVKPAYPHCDTSRSTGILRSQADDADREAKRFTRLSKRFTILTGKIDGSRTARLLDDAKDSLQSHIDKAETALSDSKGKTADEKTRTDLKIKLDHAKKTLKGADVDAMGSDGTALDRAVATEEASVEAKRKADQDERNRRQAQREAEQPQNETQSGSGSTPPYAPSSTPQYGSGSGSSSSGSESTSSGSDGWPVPSQGSDPLPDTDSGL